jgi:hypothetical protein
MEENIYLEIAANLLHLTKIDEDGNKVLDDEKVAKALRDAVAAVYGDHDNDEVDLPSMDRGVDVLEEATDMYDDARIHAETDVSRKSLGRS